MIVSVVQIGSSNGICFPRSCRSSRNCRASRRRCQADSWRVTWGYRSLLSTSWTWCSIGDSSGTVLANNLTRKARSKMAKGAIIPAEQVERSILLVRGPKVMLDSDLAALYEVETSQLVRAVKRNLDRFPVDFAFQLTPTEFADLKCQIGISNQMGRTAHIAPTPLRNTASPCCRACCGARRRPR